MKWMKLKNIEMWIEMEPECEPWLRKYEDKLIPVDVPEGNQPGDAHWRTVVGRRGEELDASRKGHGGCAINTHYLDEPTPLDIIKHRLDIYSSHE